MPVRMSGRVRRFSVVIVYVDGDIDVASDDDGVKARTLYDQVREEPEGLASVTLMENGQYVEGVKYAK